VSELFPGFTTEKRRVGSIHLNVCHNVSQGSDKPPLLLLHGFPQTHAIWHKVAPSLAERYTLVMPDLRGYGDSDKPPSDPQHAAYSKRAMASDNAVLMRRFGFESFFVCGHDRGARVGHRLALDFQPMVRKLMLLDISPTLTMYEATDMRFAREYYHWFFLIQPEPLPETLILGNPGFYLRKKTSSWGSAGGNFFDPRAYAEYERCFENAETVHSMCEDYRASAGIDLEHDRFDHNKRISCPLHVLWGEQGVVNRLFKPIADWQRRASGPVSGRTMPGGHYIPEQSPELLVEEMLRFFV
jgi:haloacetate dehalogenase